MSKSIVDAHRGVPADQYYNKGATQAPSNMPRGAVPSASFSVQPENKAAIGCYLTKRDGSACRAPVVKGTDLCVGHTKQVEKGIVG